jgi:hypothetical protein
MISRTYQKYDGHRHLGHLATPQIKETKCAVESDREQVERLVTKLYSAMATLEKLLEILRNR